MSGPLSTTQRPSLKTIATDRPLDLGKKRCGVRTTTTTGLWRALRAVGVLVSDPCNVETLAIEPPHPPSSLSLKRPAKKTLLQLPLSNDATQGTQQFISFAVCGSVTRVLLLLMLLMLLSLLLCPLCARGAVMTCHSPTSFDQKGQKNKLLLS